MAPGCDALSCYPAWVQGSLPFHYYSTLLPIDISLHVCTMVAWKLRDKTLWCKVKSVYEKQIYLTHILKETRQVPEVVGINRLMRTPIEDLQLRRSTGLCPGEFTAAAKIWLLQQFKWSSAARIAAPSVRRRQRGVPA